MKFFVIGDRDTVEAFALAGVDGFPVGGAEEAAAALAEAETRKDLGVVLVTETTAGMVREEMQALAIRRGLPLVLEIPGIAGPLPDRRSLDQMVKSLLGLQA